MPEQNQIVTTHPECHLYPLTHNVCVEVSRYKNYVFVDVRELWLVKEGEKHFWARTKKGITFDMHEFEALTGALPGLAEWVQGGRRRYE